MVSKTVLVALCLVVAVTAIPPNFGGGPVGGAAVGANPFIPPWIASASWFPKWTPCTVVGATCIDCNTRSVCTKVGALERSCTDPTLPYCNLGECSATPTAACAPPAVPATAA